MFSGEVTAVRPIVCGSFSRYVGSSVLDINKPHRYGAIGRFRFWGRYSRLVFIMRVASNYATCEYQASLLHVFIALSAVVFLLHILRNRMQGQRK